MIVADSTALMAIERNMLVLLMRMPWRETTTWMAMKIIHIMIEIPSKVEAVKAVQTCGAIETGLMKMRISKIRLKALVSNIGANL